MSVRQDEGQVPAEPPSGGEADATEAADPWWTSRSPAEYTVRPADDRVRRWAWGLPRR